jgi:hypothetical protein
MLGDTNEAMQDVKELANHYAQYPSLKGIYLWNLTEGAAWADLPLKLNRLIPKMADFTLQNSFETPERKAGEDGDVGPEPDDGFEPDRGPAVAAGRGLTQVAYESIVNVIPEGASNEQAAAIFQEAWSRGRESIGGSYDDAGIGDLDVREVNLYGIPQERRLEFVAWYALHYLGVDVNFLPMPE